jgi:hypothetical protein
LRLSPHLSESASPPACHRESLDFGYAIERIANFASAAKDGHGQGQRTVGLVGAAHLARLRHVHLTQPVHPGSIRREGFFALITERKIGRGSYRSAMALRAEITSFIEHHNAAPSRSDGQNQPTIFSAPSNASVLAIRQPELESDELLVLDTSGRSYSATATFE